MASTHSVTGGGGLNLHVREWGNEDGPPVLLVHGWSQSHLCWSRQYDSDLARDFRLVAFDNRGHGMSDQPLDAEAYTDGKLWADDVAAVISALGLERPVLVGWSYGGFIMCDYARHHGTAAIAGINFVGAAVTLDPASIGSLIGPVFRDNFEGATAADLPTNIAAMRRFVRGCFVKRPPEDDYETALCWNMVVPPAVRAHLAQRQIDNDDVLGRLDVPVLMTQGREDAIVLPAMAEHILEVCPPAQPSWYDGVGHAPFLEDPERFNRELRDFALRARRTG